MCLIYGSVSSSFITKSWVKYYNFFIFRNVPTILILLYYHN
nr:MAG TPA: hypothetical protein [Bacteriophage sp.]